MLLLYGKGCDVMKLAFIGTGKIIIDALFAVSAIDNIEITAIFARPHSKSKAVDFAEKYNIPEIFTDYDKLLAETTADTVYIGLINSAHYAYAKAALMAGKHVILEKPFTGFANEARELQAIAEEKKRFIFEAVTVLHSDIIREMEKNISKLGPIRMALCNYSQYSSRYDEYLAGETMPHAFNPEYYGGALYDINVYNIHYCVWLFGKPADVEYYPNIGPNGIDTSGTLIMKYDGFSAVCTGAKDSDSPGYICVQGEKGWFRLDGKPNSALEMTTQYVDENNDEKVRDASGAMVRASITDKFTTTIRHHRMVQEFTEFAEMIDNKDYELAKKYLDETIAVVEILEKARTKAGIKF